jgi:hypothetical protein
LEFGGCQLKLLSKEISLELLLLEPVEELSFFELELAFFLFKSGLKLEREPVAGVTGWFRGFFDCFGNSYSLFPQKFMERADLGGKPSFFPFQLNFILPQALIFSLKGKPVSRGSFDLSQLTVLGEHRLDGIFNIEAVEFANGGCFCLMFHGASIPRSLPGAFLLSHELVLQLALLFWGRACEIGASSEVWR